MDIFGDGVNLLDKIRFTVGCNSFDVMIEARVATEANCRKSNGFIVHKRRLRSFITKEKYIG